MTPIRWLLILLTLGFGASPMHAAEPYPPGSRIGLTAPTGMVTSKTFFGYEDADNNAAIILVALPVQAYAAERVNLENIRRAKLRVATRKWMAGRLAPKKYGKRLTDGWRAPTR